MSAFLVYVPVPSVTLAEPLLKSAQSFLEAHGGVTPDVVGAFKRPGRKKDTTEHLVLARFTTADAVDEAAALARARALEGILRATLASAHVHAGDVRVFVEQES